MESIYCNVEITFFFSSSNINKLLPLENICQGAFCSLYMTCGTLLPHMQSGDSWCLWCFPFSSPAISCSVSVCRASGVDQGVTAAAVGCCGRNVDPPLLRIGFPPLAPGCLEGKPASCAVSVALSCSSFLQGSCHGTPDRNAAGVLSFPGVCM